MTPDLIFLVLFLTLFLMHYFLERVLAILNIRYVLARKNQIPEILQGFISEENYKKSILYTQARTRFDHIDATLGAVTTLIFLFSGLIPWLDIQFHTFKFEELTHGTLLVIAFILIGAVINLPLNLYETFNIETRFGFNRTTRRTFWMDKLKGFLLLLIIGVPFLYALLALIIKTGPFWWFWAALFVIGFQFLMMLLYPIFIAPLFNKFKPLENGELKQQLEKLAEKCRFTTGGILMIDGSTRSTHSNAYFTGIGKARRIVLFDTLVQQLNIPEMTAVLAHEIGHYKKKHILKMLSLSAFLTLMGFFFLKLLMNWPPMYHVFGISVPSVPVGILIFSLIGGTFIFWLGPLFHAMSRFHEYEADAYSIEQTGNPSAMKTALLKLFEKNLSNLTPHPAYSKYHYSHPALIERITAFKA